MFSLLVALIIVGVILYLAETYIPMDPMIRTILRVVVLIVIMLWLLNFFGVLDAPMRV